MTPPRSPHWGRCVQRSWSANARFAVPPGLVADGRDMGTVVFPQAKVQDFSHRQPGGEGPKTL